ncbi:C6 zinc finger domain-containing protein [Stachybotrys elegans]|uniref:C6 zinc finger domain-containing protein n=1 Tax=Stachybotrys elegans TaxID=80388 RepID=A0A8K0SGY2_9HYPO|nr:C6 zinc finger domain-containing protein [Stachybotrys elegans]
MTQAVKRACDACHRRKVKCDGINPCRNCSSAQLSCTYNAIPQKKGPKGSRAKVISELRETQRQTSLSAKVQNRMNGIPCPTTNQSLAPTPGLLSAELVKDCVNFFFDHLYPQMPILDRRLVEQQMLYMEQNRDAYCLMTSLCAFVMLQPGMSMPANDPFNLDMVPGANIISSQLLMEEAIRVRKGYEYLDSISLNVLATNYFLFACSYGQEMHDKAWYYLREASTMIHMTGMNDEEHYMKYDVSESTRRRRLYWLYYATERAYGLHRNRPLTLQATVNPPSLGDDPADPQAHQLSGYYMLISLFRPFDDAFIATWNKTRSHLSPQYISGLHKQVQDLAQSYLCQDSNFNDLRTNQQWLKNTAWQLSSATPNANNGEDVSFQYPANLARDLLVSLCSQFPGRGMELMNSGLLIETTAIMTEYLSMQPASRDPFTIGPREHLTQMLSIIAVSRSGDYRFLPLLANRVTEVLHRLVNPMLLSVPESCTMANMASMDMFDGFGTAGMAQPPAPLPVAMEGEYDRKFSVEEYDKQYAMEMNSGTPDSSSNTNYSNGSPPGSQQQPQEINTNFVSSPVIMSPGGMEYSHGMNNFGCTPMSEMVMSPLGNPGQSGGMNLPPSQNHHGHDGMNQQQQQHMNGLGGPQAMRGQAAPPQMSNPHAAMNNIINLRQPQPRQNSFHMQTSQTPMRTVGDFHGLQRASSEATNSMVGLNSMSGEIDFNALR